MKHWDRRSFLTQAGMASAALLIGGDAAAESCGVATTKAGDGPFYKPNAPFKAVLREANMPGTRLMFFGRVVASNCKPLPNSVIDLWHSDTEGNYDNEGFRLRGRVMADRSGLFRVETIQPKGYPTGGGGYRCPHFHIKVHSEGRETFTTELYFPDDPLNKQDSSFREARMVKISSDGKGKAAEFDFVLG